MGFLNWVNRDRQIMFFLAPWLNTLRSSLREFNGARQMTRISRVFVFFVVSLRIQVSELLRANNPPEGGRAVLGFAF